MVRDATERAEFVRLTEVRRHVRAREAEGARQLVVVAELVLGGQEAAEALEVLASMERRIEQTRIFYLRLGMQCYDMLLADERPDAGKILTGLGDWLPNATALHPESCGNGITAVRGGLI